MIKKIAYVILSSAIAAAILYLAGSFFAASFDISKWYEGARYLISVIWLMAVCFIIVFHNLDTENL